MKLRSIILGTFIFALSLAIVASFYGHLMAQQKATVKSKTTKKDAAYWFNKGALVSTYGNNEAAVKYFQKAIVLNPNFSRAYFSQGVSFGQLGQFQKAIAQIDRAIKMEPQNGMYYYGRGRVYLMSGDKTRAMEDFKKAAELEDEDALNYLDYIGQDKK